MYMKVPYSTQFPGIGGRIKYRYADFIVEVIFSETKVCEVKRFAKEGESFPLTAIPEKESGKEHLHCDLEKINKDLNFVIKKMARFIHCSKKRIGYSGLKDKRGVTCQRISFFSPHIEAVKNFHSRGIELRNPSWEKDRIELGTHKGNRFTIIIRNIAGEKKELKKRVEEALTEMEKEGIANFFGEQRFGGMRNITHLVGKDIVHGRFEQAVTRYLTSSFPKEKEEIKEARNHLSTTQDYAKALKAFPQECQFERALCNHLNKNPNDFVGALGVFPKNMRYLFTHAYQSYLFNRIIEKRLSTGIGLKRTNGDILIDSNPTAPLYGYSSEHATGTPGEIETEILEEEGVSRELFKVKEMPELSSTGTRKSIVLTPKNAQLISIEADEYFPEKRALTIRFDLPKGTYATTLVRELIKEGEHA